MKLSSKQSRFLREARAWMVIAGVGSSIYCLIRFENVYLGLVGMVIGALSAAVVVYFTILQGAGAKADICGYESLDPKAADLRPVLAGQGSQQVSRKPQARQSHLPPELRSIGRAQT